jgi:hypothetical protein
MKMDQTHPTQGTDQHHHQSLEWNSKKKEKEEGMTWRRTLDAEMKTPKMS